MIQLFVGSKRVDLFKDENIEIQDSIQDAKDIGKIFTTFSRTFTVPANKNNNNVFQNFYNFDVVNGFDPREKVRSVITKNGATYRNGFIQIRKVKLKNNKPTSYTIFFTGLLSTLKDKLQDDKLNDLLELDNYNHKYNKGNVELGFENYLTVDTNLSGDVTSTTNVDNADIAYPFISVKDRYALNALSKVKRVNQNNNITTGKLDYQDLKPAINVKRIISAIENQYNIEFSNSFLKDNKEFTRLFLFLNLNKGRLGIEQTFDFKLFNTDYDPPSTIFTNDIIEVYETNSTSGFGTNQRDYTYNYTIQATGSALATIKLIDEISGVTIISQTKNFDNDSTSFANLFFTDINDSPKFFKPYLQVKTQEPGISSFNVNLQITESTRGDTISTVTDNLSINQTSVSSVIILNQIPRMKVIDFLQSIFKLYNLTAEVVDDKIKVQTLNDFYSFDNPANQNKVDITRFVDVTNSSVNKVETIKQFDFKHQDAETLLLLERNKATNDEYGNLEYEIDENSNKVIGGNTLNIQTNLYKILYERLRNGAIISDIMFGWYVNDDNDPLSDQPILFYVDRKNTNNAIEFKGNNTPSNYLAPLNATDTYSTNFSNEFNEFDFSVELGTYKKFYENYVDRVFSPQSRKVELDAVLRDDFILNYKLSDIIIYQNRKFIINDIKINLNTNKAKLTLLNIPIEVINFTANDENSESLGLSTSDINVTGDAKVETFDIVSDSDWDITVDDTWLSVNPTKGTRNATIELTTQENNTGNVRTAKVAVSTNNLTQEITLTQAIK